MELFLLYLIGFCFIGAIALNRLKKEFFRNNNKTELIEYALLFYKKNDNGVGGI